MVVVSSDFSRVLVDFFNGFQWVSWCSVFVWWLLMVLTMALSGFRLLGVRKPSYVCVFLKGFFGCSFAYGGGLDPHSCVLEFQPDISAKREKTATKLLRTKKATYD